ncbi:phage tail tape measure protein [Paenibacillaceae bacterium]|nr:phage tail tape measure protein [Paenibacillaceae bacterium]
MGFFANESLRADSYYCSFIFSERSRDMSNDLRILVNVGVNEGKSIGEINSAISKISKSDALRSIKLKLDIDSKVIQTLNEFSKNLSKISQISNTQNAALNGVTSQVKNQSDAFDKAATSARNYIKEQERLSRITGKQTTVYGNPNNSNKTTVSGRSGGIQDIVDSYNPKKDLADQTKLANQIADGRIKAQEKFEKMEADSQKKRIEAAHRLANVENKRIDDRKNLEREYDQFWQKSLHSRTQEELKVANKLASDRKALEQSVDERWQKNLKEREQKQQNLEQGRIKNENQAWHQAHLEKEKREQFLHGQRVQDTYRAYSLAQAEDKKYNQKRLQDEISFQQQKARLETKLADTNRRFGADNKIKTQVNELNSALANTAYTKNYRNALADIDIQLKRVVSTANTSGSHIDKFSQQMGIAASRTIQWGLTMGVLYGSLNKLKQAVGVILEVDKQITTLKRVMNEDTNFEKMMQGSIKIANELGRSIIQVNDAMTGFARQGYSEDQVLALSKTATLMTNISELSGDEAMSSLTAAMTVFNIEASNSMRIINSLNEVDNNFAIGTKDLAIAMQKSGSVAKTFGVSLEELVGHTAAIGIQTRESGSIIGKQLAA